MVDFERNKKLVDKTFGILQIIPGMVSFLRSKYIDWNVSSIQSAPKSLSHFHRKFMEYETFGFLGLNWIEGDFVDGHFGMSSYIDFLIQKNPLF